MRIVRFDSQERVDLPDFTQLSFLVLGEFRRHVRGLILGPSATGTPAHNNLIVRGFKVEAQTVPDATVRVQLDPGGVNPLGFAVGAEDLGSRIDHGQLIGGDGMDGTLEGNASVNLDFSGQPVGTYTVQMRFLYNEGSNDNRAFWDEGGNTEFVAATDTRHLPTFELRLSGAASADWIDLASVAWGGATIVTANITDLRTFALEGTTPWQQASQVASTGGIADFSRSSDRGTNGFNELYPFVRGLARQIQDIKGQDDSGNFNWWGRAFSSMDPADGLGAQTKSLRTIDHVMYTVGDGTTEYGDYNGSTGLHTLLTMIAAQLASLPRHITIVLKSRSTGAPTHALSATYALGDKRVKIVGGDGGGSGVLGRAVITCSTAAASNVLSFTTNGGLELENLAFSDPTNEVTMFSMPVANARFAARGCQFENLDTRTRAYADVPSDRLAIVDCTMGVLFGGGGVWQIANLGLTATPAHVGRITGTSMSLVRILLYRGTAATLTGLCAGLRISDTKITGMLTPHAASTGTIVGISATNVVLDNCYVTYQGDENAITLASGANGATEYETANCAIRNTQFSCAGATHAADVGTGAAEGTGWSVSVLGTATKLARAITIEDCSFTGTSSVDAGAVRIKRAQACAVIRPNVHDVTIPATGRYTCFSVVGAASTPIAAGVVIDRPVVERFTATGTNLRGFDFDECQRVDVLGGVFRAVTTAGAAFAVTGFAGRLTSCGGCTIADCRFEQWEDGTNDRGILLLTSSDSLVFRHNVFKNVGGRNVYLSSGTGTAHVHNLYDGNVFDEDGTNLVCGIDASLNTSLNEGSTYVNNRMSALTAKPIIRLGDDRKFICTGNHANAGDIDHTTAGSPFATAIGYAETFKANIVANYT